MRRGFQREAIGVKSSGHPIYLSKCPPCGVSPDEQLEDRTEGNADGEGRQGLAQPVGRSVERTSIDFPIHPFGDYQNATAVEREECKWEEFRVLVLDRERREYVNDL